MTFCILAAATAGCGGCGGPNGDSQAQWGGMTKEEWLKRRQERAKQEEREAEEARKKDELAKQESRKKREEESKKQADERAATLAARRARGQEREEPTVEKTEEPPLPDAFSDWKADDFLKARLLGDPRLAPAVEYYGKQHVGDEAAAQLLTQLLEGPSAAGSADEVTEEIDRRSRLRRGLGSRQSPAIEAIVAALAANGTAKARQTLEGLLVGTVSTENSQGAQAALKALVEHPSPEHEEIVLRVLTAAQTETGREGLRQQAVALLKTSASSRFRVRLAEHLAGPAVSADLRAMLEPIIQEPTPVNFEARVVLYASPQTGDEMRASMEREFLAYSSEAMGCLLRLPEWRDRLVSDPAWPRRVAQQLWTPRFQIVLERRLERAQSLSESGLPLMLATTIPTAPMRSVVFRTLERRWTDGPDALKAAGYPVDVISEPGLLLVLKTILQRSGVSTPAGRTARYGEVVRARYERDARLAGQWSMATQELAELMCSRFRSAGQADADAARLEGKAADFAAVLDDLPVEVPEGANVVAAVRCVWPGGIAEEIPGEEASPLLIHYVRIEGNADPRQVAGLYRRRLVRAESREIAGGFWLDSFNSGTTGHKRSIDVFVRALDPDPLRLPDEPQDLGVDILSLELSESSQSAGS